MLPRLSIHHSEKSIKRPTTRKQQQNPTFDKRKNFYSKLKRELPSSRGGYVLVFKLNKSIHLNLLKKQTEFPSSYYAYIGSAGGPGGLRARILRHVSLNKRIWWHIDKLTTLPDTSFLMLFYTTKIWGVYFERKISECLNSEKLRYIKGFGSSDDRKSPSHLFLCDNIERLVNKTELCIFKITNNDFHKVILY